jgi:hypothetical protein
MALAIGMYANSADPNARSRIRSPARATPHRIETTRFFAFADTVEVLNYERTNQGHGWMGLRFQLRPHSEPNDCVLHMKLHDTDPLQQQYALGIIGVNMLYSCMFLTDPEEMLMSLLDGITNRRIEIDMFRLNGPDFKHVDNRLMAFKLVKNGLTKAAMFGPDGNVMQPSMNCTRRTCLSQGTIQTSNPRECRHVARITQKFQTRV